MQAITLRSATVGRVRTVANWRATFDPPLHDAGQQVLHERGQHDDEDRERLIVETAPARISARPVCFMLRPNIEAARVGGFTRVTHASTQPSARPTTLSAAAKHRRCQ